MVGGIGRYLAMGDSGCCEGERYMLAFALTKSGVWEEKMVPVFFLPKHWTLCVEDILGFDGLGGCSPES